MTEQPQAATPALQPGVEVRDLPSLVLEQGLDLLSTWPWPDPPPW